MGASRDVCPICVKPFYGKQKFVRCGTCDIRFHNACVQPSEADQATITLSGESAFTCDACVTSLDSSSVMKLASSHGSEPEPVTLPPVGAKSSSPSNIESSISAVSAQLEAVRLNGQSTLQLIESLVGMVSKLTEEVAYLKE
jgi:hypothetical protein